MKLFGMHDEIKTTNLGEAEFFLLDASLVHLLPHLDTVRTAGTFNSSLMVFQMDQGGRKLSPVRDAREEDLCGLMEAFLIRLVARRFYVSNIRRAEEVLQL